MDELISKRAVIEAIEKARANVGHNLERSIGKSIIEILDDVGRDVDRLPSAQLSTNLASLGTDVPDINVGELISRQSAIDVVQNRHMMLSKEKVLLINDLEKLPSAEPQIIRCKDCKNWDTTWTNDFSPNYHYCPMVDGYARKIGFAPMQKGEPMSDLIDRQAAINALRDYLVGKRCPDDGTLTCRLIENEVINKLPLIQLRTGKWIDTGSNEEWYAREYKCSECGDTMLGDANFCPNCGAKMEEKT